LNLFSEKIPDSLASLVRVSRIAGSPSLAAIYEVVMKRWIRSFFTSPSRTIVRRPQHTLSLLNLEERITPDARDIAGLRFNAPGTFVGSSSNASISTAVEVGLVPASGQPFVPLLSLPSGVAVTSSPASAKINSTLSVRGVTFTGNNLAFAFDQANGKFAISGDAAFTTGGVTIGTSFGSALGTPGLVIQNGQLASVDLAVTTQFSFGSVGFNTQDLRLKLDNSTATSTRYTVTGRATATVQGQSNPITLTTQLGVPSSGSTPAKPGLVIVNGALTQLTTGITGNFSVAGVTLNAKDLTFSMNTATKNYSVFGSAGMTFQNKAVNIGFDVLLGTSTQPGVSIVNGRLQSLNLGVTSNFDVGGISITTKALTVTLDVPRNTFTLNGSAGFAFTGAGSTKLSVDVAFGSNNTQGLKIVNGTLTELSVGVTSDFSLAGLSFKVRDLRFEYSRNLNRYGLSGGVFVSTAPVARGKRVLDNVGVQLGSTASPGIVVESGLLQNLDIALIGNLNLGSFSSKSPVPGRTDPLRVRFARSTGVLQFTGGLQVSLASKFTASAELTDGGLTINTNTGVVNLGGLRLVMSDTRLGPVFVHEAFLQFRLNTDGSVDLSAGAKVDLPAGITVDGSFDIVESKLRKIMLTVSKDPGIPLGNTGVFVSRLSGEIKNIDTPDRLQVTASVTMTAGPSYRIGGVSVSLIQGTVQLSLDLNPIERIIIGNPPDLAIIRLTGKVSMLGEAIPVNSGGLSISFSKNTGRVIQVQGFATVNFFNGFFRGTIFFSLNLDQRNIIISAELSLRIPEVTLPKVGAFPETKLGGQELASVSVVLILFQDNPLNSSLTFTTKVGLEGARLLDVTASINFRGEFTASGKLLAIPFGPVTKKFPALFTDPADADPSRATRIKILSVDKVPGSRTNDLKVTFEASSAGALVNANVFFLASEQGVALGDIGSLTSPGAGQTFNQATGIGTTIIKNPEKFAKPGKPFTLTGEIVDSRRGLSAKSSPFGPIAGVSAPVVNPAPTLVIQSIERVAGSATNDLRVTFRATTTGELRNATAGFSVGSSTDILGFINLGSLDANQTYNASTGIGTTILTNPDRQAIAGRAFTIKGFIQDNFGTATTPASATIPPVFGPPTIQGTTTLSAPVIGQAATVPVNSIVISDPAAQSDPNARVRVSLRTDSAVTLSVPTNQLPASIRIESNNGKDLVLTGSAGDINIVLDTLSITRRFDNAVYSITVFVDRVGVNGGAVQRDITLTANVGLGLSIPSTAPSTANFATAIRPLAGSTLQVFPNSQIRRVGIKLVQGTGTNARPPFNGDVLDSIIPDGVPLFAFFDAGAFELIIAGDGTETLADFERAIQAVTYTTTGSSGRINLQVNLTDSRRQNVSVTKTILIQLSGSAPSSTPSSATPPRQPSLAPLATSGTLFLDVGTSLGVYTGTGPAVVSAGLTLTKTTAGDPVLTATVAFSGLYDSTSDTLSFTAVGGITGAFDPVRGVLTLTAGPSSTTADFQAVLRSVVFSSTRKNPTAYPREIQFQVTTTGGATSPREFGRTLLAMNVPTVPPSITGTTTNLIFPPNGPPLAIFPDLDLVYPDEALPPPAVPIGTIIPGSIITRATVTIATNYIRNEDFLTFTPVGAISGTFYPDTGELLFEGSGTLAEYEQVLQSVKYQNKNTSPSTADRTFVVTLDDGSASDNPVTLTRIIQPQSDGLDTIRTSGNLNRLVVGPTAGQASLGLGDLNYAPRPGETQLIYTILQTPQFTGGFVRLADGTIAEIGMEVTIEQLRGAVFVLSDTPRSGTVPFSFSISGRNPITGALTQAPIIANLPIETTNVAPTAIADSTSTPAGSSVTLDLVANDTDLNRDLLLVESFTQGANGTVVQNDDGTFTYTPRAGFSGTDTFTYTIEDGVGAKSTATVTINVVAPASTLPNVGLIGFREFAIGSDVGDKNTATLFDPNGAVRYTVNPFGSFTGGVRTAAADFNGDGVADLVVGTGPGRSTQVIVLDGKTQAQLFTIDPFEAAFQGGVFVTAGDISGDGIPDLIITPDEGGGPRVRIFSGKDFQQIADFFGIDDPAFRGGARAAVADINGDGVGDLIVSAGFGGGPRVAVFDGKSLKDGALTSKPFGDFFAFEPALRNGAFVTGGDLDGDGFAELIAGGGPGGGPRVTAFSGRSLLNNTQDVLANFFGGDVNTRGGIRVTVKNLDDDNRADLIVGAGAGSGSRATAYLGKNIQPNGTPPTVLDFDAFAGFPGGVFVG
jgi:Bacterial Ig domain/FG-GAP-like repeat